METTGNVANVSGCTAPPTAPPVDHHISDQLLNLDARARHLVKVLNATVLRYLSGEDSQDRTRESLDHWLNQLIREYRDIIGLDKPHKKRRAPGAVYVIRSDSGLYKIGRSTSVIKRKRTLQGSHGTKLKLVFSRRIGLRAAAVEKHLHQLFAAKRTQGEWFALVDHDVARVGGIVAAYLESYGK